MNLKTAIIPHDIAYADPGKNLNALTEAMVRIEPDTRLVVLPELFSTGYVKNTDKMKRFAVHSDGTTISLLKHLAAQHDTAIAGSMLASDDIDGQFFNRAFIVLPDGSMSYYDKRHLFSHSGEDKVFTAGTSQSPIVTHDGWRIKLMVCYDLRFPCWCRNRDLEYDLLLFPSNWPEERGYAFRHLLIARAIENQACVVGANRGGSDPFGNYPHEMCAAFDHFGRPVGEIRDGVVYATFDRTALDRAREKFPVHLDADPV